MNNLTDSDISQDLRDRVFMQDYSKKTVIDGVKVVNINRFGGEDGTFEEMARFDESGNLLAFPEFKVRQISRSKLLSGAIKAWHLHYKQEDIWYVLPEDHMMLGLWDVRENSPTKDVKMRVPMGVGVSKLVYIPRGVAHGVVNLSTKEGNIIYFTNEQFNLQDLDEHRLAWDAAGADFWEPIKG